ncbi:MAG: phosphoribosyltransferase, partial [Verrucomicrobia bacterium]|nr:phosphoribosyltransferase [Verrucomicrobiota bacterium]
MTYQDRKQAGIQLSAFLQDYQKDKNLLVLGLPRGGVQVAEG